jgi:arginyl-tRNA synthetase
LGKVQDFTNEELVELYDILAQGALKFFLLRVDPKKRIIFNPEESIDFHGFTGPFVQFSHARLKSILRKESPNTSFEVTQDILLPLEKDVLLLLDQYDTIIEQAAAEHNPSAIAIYLFTLAKTINSFITEHRVLTAETELKKQVRLRICKFTATIIASGMQLLGIRVPERM